ncbi:hypothetical protein GCM10027592_21420 [Spirosoma flavus]
MKSILLVFSLLVSRYVLAQTTAPFDDSHWEIVGKMSKETFQGKEGILLTEGTAYLKDDTFLNGIIEFDMMLAKGRYFPGVRFRMQDKDNYESVYLRPHQLGNPDALQYTPVYNQQAAWQLYYGDGYSTAVTYPLNEWVHIKLLVSGTQAEVYVGDHSKPAFVIHKLKRTPYAGSISLENTAPVPTRFANFQYTKRDNPPLQGKFKAEEAAQSGTISSWQVSNTFDKKRLESSYTIPKELASQLIWQKLSAENSGTVNFSPISKLSETSNTVFAKFIIVSEKPQIKKLRLGFSDEVRVYTNGKLVYGGQDEFLSRDYRFLGTIGYFDAIYLDLRQGKNEIWFAVSESFGGWGIKGLITDQSGIKLE